MESKLQEITAFFELRARADQTDRQIENVLSDIRLSKYATAIAYLEKLSTENFKIANDFDVMVGKIENEYDEHQLKNLEVTAGIFKGRSKKFKDWANYLEQLTKN